MPGLESLFATQLIVAKAAITWTPLTFYVAVGIVQAVVILVGFRLMQVDPEHNTFVGAILAAGIISAGAFFLKDAGVVGIMISGALMFGMLVAITSGEALKSLFMTTILVLLYGGAAMFLLPRTPLNINDVAGFPRVVMTGGLSAEPITEKDADDLLDRDKTKKDE